MTRRPGGRRGGKVLRNARDGATDIRAIWLECGGCGEAVATVRECMVADGNFISIDRRVTPTKRAEDRGLVTPDGPGKWLIRCARCVSTSGRPRHLLLTEATAWRWLDAMRAVQEATPGAPSSVRQAF